MAALARGLITKQSYSNLTRISSILLQSRACGPWHLGDGVVRGFATGGDLEQSSSSSRPMRGFGTEELEQFSSSCPIRLGPGLPTTTGAKVFANLYGPGNFKYWRVFLFPDNYPEKGTPRDEIINYYVKILAKVLGSEDEARKRIYSVSTRHLFFFVCKVPMDIAIEIDHIRGVYVEGLSDSEAERPDHSQTGEPFVNGEAVPYDPKYHKAMVKHFWKYSFSFKGSSPPTTKFKYDPKTRTMLPVMEV